MTADAALIGFFDLNTIPLSMVERIDVLPTGSSAIYGGEALAGVINIVLRSNFEGAEASIVEARHHRSVTIRRCNHRAPRHGIECRFHSTRGADS